MSCDGRLLFFIGMLSRLWLKRRLRDGLVDSRRSIFKGCLTIRAIREDVGDTER